MKKQLIILFALLSGLTSCTYLDIDPELGLDEQEVFTKYTNYKKFLDGIYSGTYKTGSGGTEMNIRYCSFPLRIDAHAYRYTQATLTDLADAGRQGLRNEIIKAGTLGQNCSIFVDGHCPVFKGCWYLIRSANKCIENIGMLEDASEDEKNDILGQAYFLRAWFHMTLCNFFGGQPYLDHSLQADESWDWTRENPSETYRKCAEDFKKAYEYFQLCGRVRRDAFPGEAGHLENSLQNRPNGVAAMALRGRCLLYAASPLSNRSGDKKLWEEAAVANSEALDIALKFKYELLSFDKWTNNLAFVNYTNEQLWAYNYGSFKASGTYNVNILGFPITNSNSGGGQNPTQNAVDLFETKWGDPLETEAQRLAATAAGHYNEQDPYTDRDPRFYETIIFDGATAIGVDGPINIYYDTGKKTYPTTNLSGNVRSFGTVWNKEKYSYTTTGYYSRTRWDGKYTSSQYPVTDPLIRLAEVYLNYAEAANAAYGPNGGVPGQITALQAVNKIRERAGMPDVQSRFTGSSEELNKRIQNERTVEFMFEGHHYYFDERRWMIAPERMKATLYGMYIETCAKDAEHPNGKVYTRKPILHQATWKDPMYYWYLDKEEANKYKNYVNNETW